MQDTWSAVDEYFADLFDGADPDLESVLASSADAGLPSIAVSAGLGRLLYVMAKVQRAESILEIGTLGGYSTIWLARALPTGGKVVTLERSAAHADVARKNFEMAGVSDLVEIREGLAAETLVSLHREGAGPFDLIFIDADKVGLTEYLSLSLALSRPGTLILVDNVVRDGAVLDPDSDDADVQGVRAFLEMCAHEPRVATAPIQTVGAKGYDGIAFLTVTD